MELEKGVSKGFAREGVSGVFENSMAFEGIMEFSGVVKLNGRLKGKIVSNGTLIVGPNAQIEADIEADEIYVSGNVVGNITAETRVVIRPPAVFKGTVTSASLKIEEGVLFEGASYMKENAPIKSS